MGQLCAYEPCGRTFTPTPFRHDHCSVACRAAHEYILEQQARPKSKLGHNLKKYGLTEDDYSALLAAQDGKCYICQKEPGQRRLAVDHDHDSGLVRGLLCTTCNRVLLPILENDPSRVDRAIRYLHGPPAIEALGREHIVPDQQREIDGKKANGRPKLAS